MTFFFFFPPIFLADSFYSSKLKWKLINHVQRFLTPLGILRAIILEWVAVHFSRGSSQLRDGSLVSHIAGSFCPIWAMREAQKYWIGQPIPSPGDLLNPRIQTESSALQANSLPAELPGKPCQLLTMSKCSLRSILLPIFFFFHINSHQLQHW